MSVQNDILEVLNQREQPVKTSELAEALKKPNSTIRGETTRLKQKGYIEGDSQEGWVIADTGKTQLERGDIHPSMLDEEVTPRQQFEAIGRRIGIKEDRIILATDIVWSGDYDDVKWVWQALGQADIASDLRSVWVNSWRAKLHKAIPPELETELTGVSKAVAEAETERELAPSKRGREYIIVDDGPVRVGENLGDYSLQDAKDILAIRALKSRFAGAAQAGGGQPSSTEKVSELLVAMEPYINKGSDLTALKEMLADKLELQKQDILSRLPQSGQPAQPKSAIEQITEFVGALGNLKDSGPMIRAILGISEPSGNPASTALPVQLTGADGKPIVMDLSNFINLEKFRGDERRADGRHDALVGLAQTVRENLGDGVAALKAAATEIKGGAKAPAAEQPQLYECADCHTQFGIPAGEWQEVKCPNPDCGKIYTREEVLGA